MILKWITERKSSKPFDYKKFWKNRYNTYGNSILYCGNRGLTEKENKCLYKINMISFANVIRKYITKESKVLDVGCGIGMYTDYFYNNGFKNYNGIDLNNDLITNLKQRYKGYYFETIDLCKEKIKGKYDFIFMLEVMFHIINDDYARFILMNVKKALKPNGIFIINDDITKGNSYYIKRRSFDFYKSVLGLKVMENIKFNGKELWA